MSEVTIVRFHGDELQAVREGERVWVVVNRACEALGIERAPQQRRLTDPNRSPWAVGTMMVLTANDGKNYETFCLDLDSLPMWLATIEVKRLARPEAREKLIVYQRECARVLRDYFFGRRASSANDETVYQLVRAITALATRFEQFDQRLTHLEARVRDQIHDHGMISVQEHRHMQAEVKSVAMLEKLTGRHQSTRAATADIYRDMSKVAGWGGKGQHWNRLPVPLLQPALAVLAGRRKDAERAARNIRQLSLVPMDRSA